MFNIVNRYDAASLGRRFKGWFSPNSGPNAAIQQSKTVHNRTRDLARNDWSAAASIRIWSSNLIGTGIVPHSKEASFKDMWSSFVKTCDADSVLDFYGLQALVVRSLFLSGEVFIRQRRRYSATMPVPLQIQVIESDFVPYFDADTWPGMPQGNTIRSGIERNKFGARVAYWVYKEHPADPSSQINASDLVRVPASRMIHVFEPLRPGQLRGVSEMAPIVARLRGVSDFDDAVLERQRLANLFTMFVTKPLPSNYNDQLSGGPLQYDVNGVPLAGLEPGIAQELLPGEDVRFSNPPGAGAEYSEFMRWQFMGVSAGSGGIPYELLTGDLRDVSDRTLRVILNEFRRTCQQKQWLLLIPQFCQRVLDWWADTGFIAGVFNEQQAEAYKKVRWSPQAFAYVHPVQDVQSKGLEVEYGFRSRASVIEEMGEDPIEVDETRKADADRNREMLPKPLVESLPDEENDPPDDDPPDDDPPDDEEDNTEMIKAEIELLKAQAEALNVKARLDAMRAQVDAEIAQNKIKLEHEMREKQIELQAALLGELENRQSDYVSKTDEKLASVLDTMRQITESSASSQEKMTSLFNELVEKQAKVDELKMETARLELEAARMGMTELEQYSEPVGAQTR